LGHGSGGKLSHELITSLFLRYFGNDKLNELTDSAIADLPECKLAFTTDSYVVDPVFFPGGNIGNLAISGTVNDLAVSGAVPLYLSASFIIEEGFDMEQLEEIVASMRDEAGRADIQIITGDTKVVRKGQCDKIFINTSGIGIIEKNAGHISGGKLAGPGDKIFVSGYLGDHAMAVLSARNELNISSNVTSDVAPLNQLIKSITNTGAIHYMRDITRGGLATILSELVQKRDFGVYILEKDIPMREEVLGFCELLGFDPLYLANEGKVMMVVDNEHAEEILYILRQHPLGKHAAVIGELVSEKPGRAVIESLTGGTRIINMLSGEQLPRIC